MLRIHWIPDAPWPLAIMGRPRGGEWLCDEMNSLRRAGVDVLVSLLAPDEIIELELASEPEECAARGIEFCSFPVTDRGVPDNQRAFRIFLDQVLARADAGRKIAIHCRAGIGRSSFVAASLLGLRGMNVDQAFTLIARARGCAVPDTPEQRAWVIDFVRGTQSG
jgi:protein-tyrosine phosphatase